MIVKCKFVSVWDDDIEVITDAELDTESGEILNIEQAEDFDSENVNILTDEYIIAEPKYDEDLDEWDGNLFRWVWNRGKPDEFRSSVCADIV